MTSDIQHQEITDLILKAFYKVYNDLGFGFLEKVYQNAMFLELCKSAHKIEAQKKIKVRYQGVVVGEYYADLIVDGKVIVELKAAEGLVHEHEIQLINYLKATDLEVGLLLNFGKKPQFKRKYFTNDRKP